MFNLPPNSWNVNNNDPINSFSHDQYYSHNFQKPFPNQQEYQYNYTLNSKQEVSHHLDHPQYHSCTDQPLSFPNGYTSPFEDQNLLPQNSHGINVSQQFYYSQPSFVKESAEKTSDVLLPSETFTPTITGSKLVKLDSDRSGEDLSKSVAPTHQYDQPQILRKRSGGGCGDSGNNKSKKRKDRHSKIHTGTTRPRHRRMRLSIDVAREFFDLQELLGFERASKTVEWLLRKARSEIKKLKDSNNEGGSSSTCPEMQTSSPNSESCEGASGLDEVGINGEDQGVAGTSSSKPPLVKERKKYSRSNSKRIAINPLAKELREKARERARERTREKMSKRVERVEPAIQNHRGSSGGGGGGGSRTNIANHNKDHDDHGLNINQPASNKSEEKQQMGDQLPNQNIDMNNNIVTPNSSLGAVMQVSRYDQRYEFSQEILPISNPNGWNIVQVSNHDHILQTSTTSTSTTAPIVDYETYSYLVNHLEKWNNSLVANSVSNFGTTSGATGFGVPQQTSSIFNGTINIMVTSEWCNGNVRLK
ncbi:hypothetical protein L484_022302 [Morus notabilis]|uniref:TCP domain-containing protein n=1 Tax=Morus notabilis TaxID=981085 RepID=W9S6C5_9ROSA|nr:hypothetical protein L484_022302 [Morus notabilis]